MSEININQIKGESGSNLPLTVSFNYTTVSPLVLQAVTSGQIVYGVVIVLTTIFDDPSSTLQVGTTVTSDLIFGISDIDTMVLDQYSNEAVFTIPNNDFLILTISPGASTQGIGTLYYWIK